MAKGNKKQANKRGTRGNTGSKGTIIASSGDRRKVVEQLEVVNETRVTKEAETAVSSSSSDDDDKDDDKDDDEDDEDDEQEGKVRKEKEDDKKLNDTSSDESSVSSVNVEAQSSKSKANKKKKGKRKKNDNAEKSSTKDKTKKRKHTRNVDTPSPTMPLKKRRMVMNSDNEDTKVRVEESIVVRDKKGIDKYVKRNNKLDDSMILGEEHYRKTINFLLNKKTVAEKELSKLKIEQTGDMKAKELKELNVNMHAYVSRILARNSLKFEIMYPTSVVTKK
jgi:hypothetical protein